MEEDKKKSRASVKEESKSISGDRTKSILKVHKKSMPAFGARSMSRIRMRRHSYGFSGVLGLRPVEKMSPLGHEYSRPVLAYLPTYQLEPHVPFNVQLVNKATENLLDELFTDHIYNNRESPALALRIAEYLTKSVKAMMFNRYRIMSVVTIVQDRAQCYSNAVAFLWDHERDNYVNVQKEERTSFIQATIFGVYLD